ncbi:facilitated trehalose transporter Tret1-like [Macrobrachium rosenbergii]|uniref:facilitated trehalose transporter Tret1-like n=1 Tax=Macrobrachium rosenbergii TaxID=79674 RepID=UPI0034D51582
MEENSPPPRTCCSATLKQVLCGFIVSAGMVQAGLVTGWPAVLPDLQNDTSAAFNVTDDDVKWIVSCTSFVGMVTNVLAGSMMEWVGPRLLLSLFLMPASGFWLLQCFAPNLAIFYAGRLGGGFVASVFTTLTNPLMAELVEPHLRGMLSCLPELVVSSGVLVVYVLSYVLPWQIVTGLCAVPFLPLFCLSLVIPESPFWLVRKGKLVEAENALQKLRDPRKNVARDELPSIRTSIMSHPQTTVTDQIKQLRVDYHAKPVILLVAIFILRELGGQLAVFSYTVYLFQKAGVEIEVFTCTVLVGIVRLLATATSSILVDKLGRRPFLFGTFLVCGIAQTTGGAFLLADIPGTDWVPLVAVLIFVLAYGLGVGPIPWILLGELIPTPVRSIGASICTFSFCASQFFVGLLLPELMATLGVGGSFMVFAGANFLTSIFTFVFLPESRGRSLHQLQEIFSTRTSRRPLINVASNEASEELNDSS